MDKELIKSCDLFLIDSNKGGPKFVKFLMTAPTVWQHLWRKIRGTQEYVPYYHVGMFLNKDLVIEQQWKVQLKDAERILNTKNNLIIIRYKDASPEQILNGCFIARNDMGKTWDVLNAFGKFLTWLTGIPHFARYIEFPKQEICVCRGAIWWRKAFGETFGAKRHSELTTQRMYNYIKAHPEKFEIVYEQIDER